MHRVLLVFVLIIPFIQCFLLRARLAPIERRLLFANPVNADGTKYRSGVTEEQAFEWFDEAVIFTRGGSGGAGCNSFRYGKARQHLGPIGGSGGNGGDVVLQADPSFNTLFRFRGSASFKGEKGNDGECNFLNGRFGADCVIQVPPGTVVRDATTLELVGEIKSSTDRLVVAKGGLGGQGNAANKIPRGGRHICLPPQGGQRRHLKLELKLVADIGLVGVPNAGKSTLLNAITNARPKIASYPFTTIVPNLGVCDLSRQLDSPEVPFENFKGIEGQTMVVADIPGLLEGAHRGVGLGRGFLRHIERCKIIIHVINGDSADPVGEFHAINNELQLFSPTLAAKPQVVVLNKIDLPTVAGKTAQLQETLSQAMSHSRLVCISAAERLHVPTLLFKTWQFLKKIERDEKESEPETIAQELTVLAPDPDEN